MDPERAIEWKNVRLCSPMFAFYRKKIVEAPDGERSSILQNARQTEVGTRVTCPSEYQRQSRRGRALDFGRACWMRGNAGRMNGRCKCPIDRNTFFIYDTDERGSGLEENLRLSSLNGEKIFEGPRSISSPAAWGGRRVGRQTVKLVGACLSKVRTDPGGTFNIPLSRIKRPC